LLPGLPPLHLAAAVDANRSFISSRS
jgi:hypothetical protein